MGLGSNARSSHILKTHGFLGTNAHSPHIHKTQGFWGRTLKIEPLVEQFAQHLLQSCVFCFKSAVSARGKGVCGGTMCMCIRFSRGVNILFMMRHGYIWCRCFCYRWTIQSSCRRCRYHCRVVICITMRHTSGSFAQVLTSIPALRPLYSSLHSICFSRGLVAAIQRFFSRNMGERRFHLLQCPAATYNFTPINQCHLHAGNVTFALLNECLNKTLSCDEVRFASEIL